MPPARRRSRRRMGMMQMREPALAPCMGKMAVAMRLLHTARRMGWMPRLLSRPRRPMATVVPMARRLSARSRRTGMMRPREPPLPPTTRVVLVLLAMRLHRTVPLTGRTPRLLPRPRRPMAVGIPKARHRRRTGMMRPREPALPPGMAATGLDRILPTMLEVTCRAICGGSLV